MVLRFMFYTKFEIKYFKINFYAQTSKGLIHKPINTFKVPLLKNSPRIRGLLSHLIQHTLPGKNIERKLFQFEIETHQVFFTVHFGTGFKC